MDALLARRRPPRHRAAPSALARLGLGARALAERFPRLCHVAITGHAAAARGDARATTSPTSPRPACADAAGAAADALRRHGRRRARGDDGARPRDRARPRPPRARRARAARRGRASGSRSRCAYGLTTPGRAAGRRARRIQCLRREATAGSPSPRSSRTSRSALAEALEHRRARRRRARRALRHRRRARTGKRGRAPRDLPIVGPANPSPPES